MRLTNRERWLVAGSATIIAGWLLYAFFVRPVKERIDTLTRVIPEKQRTLQQLQARSAEYIALQAGLDNLKTKVVSQDKNFELLAFLESATERFGLAQNVAAMTQEQLQLDANYSQTIVEVRLESITLKQLVEFLSELKSPDNFLQIKSLYFKKNTTTPALLDAVIQVTALKPNKSAASTL